MTEQHVSVLRRFADRVVLLFDADTAGDAAVDRAVGLFLTQPIEILIASMPAEVDPDEYLLEHGAEGFQNILDGAHDALSYKWKQLAREFGASDGNLTGQQRAVEAYLELLAGSRGSGPVDPLRWGSALARVSRLTDIPVDELNRRFKARKPRATSPTVQAPPVEERKANKPAGPLTAQDRAERWILGALLLDGRRWHELQLIVHLDDFKNERHRKLAEIYWTHQRDEGEPVFNEFLGVLQEHDPDLIELAIEATEEVEAWPDPDQTVAEAVAHIDQERGLREERKLVAALRRTTDQREERDEIDLLKELQEKARQPNLKRV
jgi:DNA primase